MINVDEKYLAALTSPRRELSGSATLSGSTTDLTAKHTDNLISFKVERTGESGKFFGYGIAQKLTLELLDKDRAINVDDLKQAYVSLGAGGLEEVSFTPQFIINQEETKRDELTNTITAVGYDVLSDTNTTTLNDYEGLIDDINNLCDTVADIVYLVAEYLADGAVIHSEKYGWDMPIRDAVNVDGTETVRELLDDIAEITQTIYFINHINQLEYKDVGSARVGTIDKTQYFELTSGAPCELTGLAATTELGDNIESGDNSGYIQALKDNIFLTLRDDIPEQLGLFVADITDFVITPFNCSWRGNFLYEIGDLVSIVGKDNELIDAYILNDSITYNGGLSQETQLEAAGNFEGDTNPSTLGEAIKETYARVDKANKQIELLVSDTEALNSAIATIQMDTESINAAVQKMEQTVEADIDGVVKGMAELTKRVDATITADDVNIAIKSELDNGVEKVVTSTGFTLDSEGLKISKSDTDINTQITENGMEVRNGETSVLTANDIGVDAANLHATTYLIIGTNSRLEDYGTNRTGCFWIGG